MTDPRVPRWPTMARLPEPGDVAGWGPRPPLSYELRGRFPDRWVRFHSLPDTKRYAASEEEYDEILRRHMTTLSQLTGHASHHGDSLLAITASWSQTATAAGRTGQLCRTMPAAAYWTSVLTDDSFRDELTWAHLWVSATSLSDPDLKKAAAPVTRAGQARSPPALRSCTAPGFDLHTTGHRRRRCR